MMKETLIKALPSPIIRFLARPYVSGYSLEAGVSMAEELLRHDCHSTIDLLGEEAKKPRDVTNAIQTYHQLISRVAQRPVFSDLNLRPTVSLKLSALVVAESYSDHIKLDEAELERNVLTILEHAREQKVEMTMDMEDFRWTDITLDLYKKFFQNGFTTVGTVLQSRLFRTASDIENLPDNCRIRLCIGIYKEASVRAYTDKKEMKEQLLKYAKRLLEKNIYLELATHDEEYLTRFFSDVLGQFSFPDGRLEIQMLLGVPRNDFQKRIHSGEFTKGKSVPVRLYVPFAVNKKDSTHYSKRRLIANPDIVTYGIKNIFGRMAGRGFSV